MLSTPVMLGAVCLPGRMPYFLFSKQLPFLLSTDFSFRERGSVQHDTAGKNLFLKSLKGNERYCWKKQSNPVGSGVCHTQMLSAEK